MIGACHCSGRRAALRDLPSAGLYPSRVLLVPSWSRLWNNENESKGVEFWNSLKFNNSFKSLLLCFFDLILEAVKIFSFLFLKRVFKFSLSISLIYIFNFTDLSTLELFKEKLFDPIVLSTGMMMKIVFPRDRRGQNRWIVVRNGNEKEWKRGDRGNCESRGERKFSFCEMRVAITPGR